MLQISIRIKALMQLSLFLRQQEWETLIKRPWKNYLFPPSCCWQELRHGAKLRFLRFWVTIWYFNNRRRPDSGDGQTRATKWQSVPHGTTKRIQSRQTPKENGLLPFLHLPLPMIPKPFPSRTARRSHWTMSLSERSGSAPDSRIWKCRLQDLTIVP